MNSDYIIVFTTIDNEEDAIKLTKTLVKKRLAACAQVEGPITSIYWWEENLEQETEWKCTLKTAAALYQDLEAELIRIHPYDTPEIIAVPVVQGNQDYLGWMDEELKGGQTS